jgi:hypothetical protein
MEFVAGQNDRIPSDFANKGTVLTNNYTFTNGCATVNASEHPATIDIIAIGDLFKQLVGLSGIR